MPGSEDCVETEIGYFSRDKKYDEEKPYTTSFPVDDIPGAKVDNHQWEFFPSQYVECDTSLSRSDFAIEQCVVTRYYSELAEMLKRLFPRYKKLAFFDHAIRSRDVRYPHAKGEKTSSAQPFRFAHVDYSEHGAKLRLQDALGPEAEKQLKTKCDMLNIWRLLNHGPTKDWPLAFCDWRTIDRGSDTIANDIIFPNALGENSYLRHNPEHKWWYLGEQKPTEIAVFRNTCVGNPLEARGFHCAFQNTRSSENEPLRESIEVRLAAFY